MPILALAVIAAALALHALVARDHFLEVLLLRHQLAVLRRQVRKPRLRPSDRILWALAVRWHSRWRDCLHIVTPGTVIRWHRAGFRLLWRWRSRPRSGRPRVDAKLRALIRDMASANPTWGAPRIHGELRKLGIDLAESTVSIYMPPRPRSPGGAQTWRTFLRNHLHEAAGIDFFTFPTATFKVLYAFVVVDHFRRRILHTAVTAHPTAAWTAQQLREAFPFDSAPRFLHRDRDGIYGRNVLATIAALGIDDTPSAPRSPWQNPFVERLIGSIRRECFDHVIPLGERHAARLLREYAGYHNTSRTHLSLEKDAPAGRTVQPPNEGAEIFALPVLGGLHHRYERRAA